MRTYDNLYPIMFFKESFERMDIRAGGIANQQTGSQVDNLRPILHHFLSSVFDVAAWAPVTSGVPHQFNF
jgi:hypothetical protein